MRDQGCGGELVGCGGANQPAELRRDAERGNVTLVRLACGLEQCVLERTAELAAAKQKLENELAGRALLEQQFRQA
jgi:C4-dicarboxylate-specific signal transduction histidine kinase